MTKRWTGCTLKLIAIVTMLIDHVGASLIENGLLCVYDPVRMDQIVGTRWGMNWWNADIVLRSIGRAAFPLFAFLLVEGFLHTRNIKKYIWTCFLFALISEIPFDLAFAIARTEGGIWAHQNIYFTLTLGLLMMAALRRFEDRPAASAVIVLAAGITAHLIRADYEEIGILVIAAFYLLRCDRRLQFMTVGFLLIAESLVLYGTAVLALFPISRYSGERGGGRLFSGKRKYVFYWFYPVHLLILYLICRGFFGM